MTNRPWQRGTRPRPDAVVGRMSSRRATAAVVLVVALAAGCGGPAGPVGGAPQAGPTSGAVAPIGPTSPAAAGATEEAAVRAALDAYNAALLGRDFRTACSALVTGGADQLAASIGGRLGRPVASCDEALAAVYAAPEAAKVLDEAARSAAVESVVITGNTATLTYTGTVNGVQSPQLKIAMAREGGAWKIPVASNAAGS